MAEAKKDTPVAANTTVNAEQDAGKEAVMAAYSNLMEAMTISNTQPAAGLDEAWPLTTERQSLAN
jgi:hypothetical protein